MVVGPDIGVGCAINLAWGGGALGWHDAQLLHHLGHIPQVPQVGGAALHHTDKVHMGDRDSLARCGDSRRWSHLQGAKMGAGHGRAKGHNIALSHHVVDVKVQVREGGAEAHNHLFKMGDKVGAKRLLVVNAVGTVMLIKDAEVTLPKGAFHHIADDSFVLFGIHSGSLLIVVKL